MWAVGLVPALIANWLVRKQQLATHFFYFINPFGNNNTGV